MTTGRDAGGINGTRILGVWFIKNKIHLASSVDESLNYHIELSIPLDKWLKIWIVYSEESNVDWFTVYINEVAVKRKKSFSAQVHKDVDLYTSDPWHPSFSGIIRELVISTGGELLVRNETNYTGKQLITFDVSCLVPLLLCTYPSIYIHLYTFVYLSIYISKVLKSVLE